MVDCEVTTWAPWSACSKTCGSGIMHRFRVIVRKPKNGGQSCGNLEENRPCDAGFCYGWLNVFRVTGNSNSFTMRGIRRIEM